MAPGRAPIRGAGYAQEIWRLLSELPSARALLASEIPKKRRVTIRKIHPEPYGFIVSLQEIVAIDLPVIFFGLQ